MGGKNKYKQKGSHNPYPRTGEGNSQRYERNSSRETGSRTTSYDGHRIWQQNSNTSVERISREATESGARREYAQQDYQQRERRESESKGSNDKLKKPLSQLVCYGCKEYFNTSSLTPRSLPCGHSLCICCLDKIDKINPVCKECKIPFVFKNLETFPPNFSLLHLIETNNNEELKDSESSDGKRLGQPYSEHSKPVVTLGSSEPRENVHKMSRHNDRPPSPERSPHNSMCLDAGIKPSLYCAVCLKWVCSKCGQVDHHRQNCCLIPKKEALDQMRKAQLDGVEVAINSVENTATELLAYEKSLDTFAFAMQAAFESIATEKERVKSMRKEGFKKKKNLDDAVEVLPNTKNLPDALAALKMIEDEIDNTKNWQKENICRTLSQEKINSITKEILLSTVMMKSLAEEDSRPSGYILAQHKVEGVRLYSQLVANGGRVLAHALKKVDTVPAGSRAMSLVSILDCLNPASSLTFLDIGWNGAVKERVFVRLVGDTLRGRQFLAMCTGLIGPSFRETGFHRIWWKGLPGEHMWGGDYSKNNGSGGTSILKSLDVNDSLPHGLKLKITAGLIAGRYEQNDISSVFRIYTKGLEHEELGAYGGFTDSFSDSPSMDEAGFGYVEHGLNVLQDAVRLGNIQDITIFDCGIVIET